MKIKFIERVKICPSLKFNPYMDSVPMAKITHLNTKIRTTDWDRIYENVFELIMDILPADFIYLELKIKYIYENKI